MNTKPKIMLAMPADVEIYRLVERNLAHYGFEVIYLNFAQQRGKFRYPSLWARLKAKFHKIILRDKNRFKEQLKQQVFKANFLNHIRNIGKVDYALFIRADLHDQDTNGTAWHVSPPFGSAPSFLTAFLCLTPPIGKTTRAFCPPPISILIASPSHLTRRNTIATLWARILPNAWQ